MSTYLARIKSDIALLRDDILGAMKEMDDVMAAAETRKVRILNPVSGKWELGWTDRDRVTIDRIEGKIKAFHSAIEGKNAQLSAAIVAAERASAIHLECEVERLRVEASDLRAENEALRAELAFAALTTPLLVGVED